MEIPTRVILGLALLVALGLGFQMKRGRSGRGNLADRKGMTFVRTALVAVLGPVLAWHLALPDTVPDLFLISVPQELRYVGLSVFVVGMSLRIWSQRTLRDQWSADLSLRPGHHLIRSGPYGWFRHPIYCSYFLIGPSLLLSTESWLAGGIAISYALISAWRIPEEEEMLLERFGDAFKEYVEKVSARQKNAAVATSVTALLLLHIYGIACEIQWFLGK